jgi:hypothetical protein
MPASYYVALQRNFDASALAPTKNALAQNLEKVYDFRQEHINT